MTRIAELGTIPLVGLVVIQCKKCRVYEKGGKLRLELVNRFNFVMKLGEWCILRLFQWPMEV